MCILHKWKLYVKYKKVEDKFLDEVYTRTVIDRAFRICSKCGKAQIYYYDYAIGGFWDTLCPEQKEVLHKKIDSREVTEMDIF